MENPQKLFPLIVTTKLEETKKFYTELAGFEVHMEMEGYFAVRSGAGDNAPEIAFTAPQVNDQGEELKPFPGDGILISVPTDNADEKAKALRAAGAKGIQDPTTKPWGWRSFIAKDPNGVAIDFFHVTGPSQLPAQG